MECLKTLNLMITGPVSYTVYLAAPVAKDTSRGSGWRLDTAVPIPGARVQRDMETGRPALGLDMQLWGVERMEGIDNPYEPEFQKNKGLHRAVDTSEIAFCVEPCSRRPGGICQAGGLILKILYKFRLAVTIAHNGATEPAVS